MSEQPKHLIEQVSVVLKEAIADAMYEGYTFGIEKNFAIRFQEEFDEIREKMSSEMQNNNGLDSHKLAALSCVAVLKSRPFSGVAHSANEYLAYALSTRIIQLYQVDRICKSEAARKALKNSLGFPDVPKTISDEQSVFANAMFSLRRLSRLLKADGINETDIVFLLSSQFFYIDSYSMDSVEQTAKDIGLKFEIN